MDNPGTIYYREDKIITVTNTIPGGSFQCDRSKDGTSRFLFFKSHRGYNLVDLAMGNVTEVVAEVEHFIS